jgi:hypothetical protein
LIPIDRHSTAPARSGVTGANVDYLRHVYASTRQWYTASETKAQLLLAVNGVFASILFGLIFDRSAGGSARITHFKADTWVFLSVTSLALICAIVCASVSLWSHHGKAGAEFGRLGIDPQDPATYRPEVLWYFGHIAQLDRQAVGQKLRTVNYESEIRTLSYHVVDLAHKVLRKHRWVNAGWAFTALALIVLIGGGTSICV